MSNDPFQLRPSADGTCVVENRDCRLRMKMLAPVIAGEERFALKFSSPISQACSIGGVAGRMTSDVCEQAGLELERELFASEDGRLGAVRMRLRSTRKKPFRLHSMVPLCVDEDADLSVSGASMRDWRVFKTSRHKSDIPTCFRPGEPDDDYEDAAINARNIRAGAGVFGDLSKYTDTRNILIEPMGFIANDRRKGSPGLALGVLGQHEHLTSITLTPAEDGKSLNRLFVLCEFDNVLVEKGDERATHWIVFFLASGEREALRDFTNLFADEFGIEPPRKPPLVVYCSWYFYARSFTERDLLENLEALKTKPVRFDVIQIDDGWIDHYGDWEPTDLFPSGMRKAAELIKSYGYEPGIWTCPYVISPNSRAFQEHPELAAKNEAGDYMVFEGKHNNYVIDPTADFAEQYFNAFYGKLKRWGYLYHKTDHLRALIVKEDFRFADPKANRAQAYRKAARLVRNALGPEAYIAACGGIFDGADAGFVDSNRSSRDVRGFWYNPSKGESRKTSAMMFIKQNVVRSYTHRLWRIDPDAAMIRKRTEFFRDYGFDALSNIALGLFDDEEAFTDIVNQYLGGGNVCISENLAELDEERRAMYRHIVPPVTPPAWVLDFERKNCPSLFLTPVAPACAELGNWWTLAVLNVDDAETERTIALADVPFEDDMQRAAVFEFRTQAFHGVLDVKKDSLTVKIPAHGTRVFRIAPRLNEQPMLIGTDMHLTGGAHEIATVQTDADRVRGTVRDDLQYPITITALFGGAGEERTAETTVAPGRTRFEIPAP